MAEKEEDLYVPISGYLEKEFRDHSLGEYHVEITSNGCFSAHLLDRFRIIEEVQQLLPRKLMPDITGYTRNTRIFVVEVKNRSLILEDVYQLRCYAELVNSEDALLVSPFDFSASDRRLLQRRNDLLQLFNRKPISIGIFNEETQMVETWYPRRPW
jgi:hypothetical protein